MKRDGDKKDDLRCFCCAEAFCMREFQVEIGEEVVGGEPGGEILNGSY